jgi:hypothetical protein
MIRDKEKFLRAMMDLYESVDHLSCAGGIEYDGDKSLSADDFIQAITTYQLSKASDPNENQVAYVKQWIKDWITRGPVFMLFNDTELLKEVNEYISAQAQPCSCGDNEACSRCPKE